MEDRQHHDDGETRSDRELREALRHGAIVAALLVAARVAWQGYSHGRRRRQRGRQVAADGIQGVRALLTAIDEGRMSCSAAYRNQLEGVVVRLEALADWPVDNDR